jgi:hypothetical protein
MSRWNGRFRQRQQGLGEFRAETARVARTVFGTKWQRLQQQSVRLGRKFRTQSRRLDHFAFRLVLVQVYGIFAGERLYAGEQFEGDYAERVSVGALADPSFKLFRRHVGRGPRHKRLRVPLRKRREAVWYPGAVPITASEPFKWRHYPGEVILHCARWYLRYPISYLHMAEMMLERGLEIDPSCIWRWVQQYGPELEKRCRPHLKPTNKSYRVDETYIKVKGKDRYLYRAADSTGFRGGENPATRWAPRYRNGEQQGRPA